MGKAWRRSGAEQDRKAYGVACREAKKLINESRQDHNAQRNSSCVDSKARWSVVKDLLHSSETDHTATDEENVELFSKLSQFFTAKISKLQEFILSKLSSISLHSPLPDPSINGTPFNTLHPVTAAEVTKIISSIKAKSSPMDFISTSVIKLCPAVFFELIGKLANLPLFQGSFPSRFKLAQVTPLLKKKLDWIGTHHPVIAPSPTSITFQKSLNVSFCQDFSFTSLPVKTLTQLNPLTANTIQRKPLYSSQLTISFNPWIMATLPSLCQ